MKTGVVTALESDTAFTAACKMVEHKIGCLVVCREGKPVGIVTDTDLIKKIICEKAISFDTQIADFMSSPVISTHPFVSVEEVADLMESNDIKRIAVVDSSSGELKGIVSAKDLIATETKMIKLLSSYLDSMKEDEE